MKTVKLQEPWKIGLEEAEMPEPKEDEALIKVKAAGICGSDINAYRGTNSLVSYPRVIGHEIAGEVIQIPEDNAQGIKPGDKVVLDPYLYCGKCYACKIGRTNCCEDLHVLGVHVDGGFAEYFVHPANMLIKVPDDMPWELIPIAEPLTIALHGLHRGEVTENEYVAIFGAGTIGLLMAMCAIHYGAVPIVIDIVEERLELAQKLGVPYVINSGKEDVQQQISLFTEGYGLPVALEATGAEACIQKAFQVVCNAGRVVLTGWPKGKIFVDTGMFTRKELDVRGARTSAGEFQEAVELIYQGTIDVRSILSKVISLEETPEMIKQIEQHPEDYLKVNVVM